MKINIYRITPNKPMIYSLESARRFSEQTKVPYEIRIPNDKKTENADILSFAMVTFKL